MSSCCSGVGVRGKNADRSVVNWVRAITTPHNSRTASQIQTGSNWRCKNRRIMAWPAGL